MLVRLLLMELGKLGLSTGAVEFSKSTLSSGALVADVIFVSSSWPVTLLPPPDGVCSDALDCYNH